MNGSSQWTPLSKRDRQPAAEEEAPFEGVPEHLYGPLVRWLTESQHWFGGLRSVYLRLRWAQEKAGVLEDLTARASANPDDLLDAADAALSLPPQKWVAERIGNELEDILRLGSSAWRVSGDYRRLERRIDATVMQARNATMKRRHGSSEYLAEAWRLAYGRNPDPSNAYHAAIKAVEAAAAPLVSPKNKRTTLGTIIRDMEAAPQKWRLAIVRADGKADLAPLLEPMRLLWHGQTDRHGTGSEPVRVTPEAATAAVHLAVMLVHWFQAGFVIRNQ